MKSINVENNAGNIYIGENPESHVDSAINELLNILSKDNSSQKMIRRQPSSNTI